MKKMRSFIIGLIFGVTILLGYHGAIVQAENTLTEPVNIEDTGTEEIQRDKVYALDRFHKKYYNKCTACELTYTANSKKGYANLYKNPEDDVIYMSVENGREFNIIYTYTDKRGKAWGMIYPSPVQSKAGVTKTAWISLKDFSIKYNQNAFLNEHKDEIQNITVEFDLSEYDTPVILWKVPLAGQIETKIDTTTNYAREYKKQFDSYYIDPYGQKWVEVEMYKGYYNGWICISDPCNEKIKLDDKLQYTLYPVSTPERNRRIMIQKISITVIGVVFVIVICFIVNIWKRKKHSNYKM